MKKIFTIIIMFAAVFVVSCSSDPSTSQGGNDQTQTSDEQAQPKPQKEGTTIAAFLSGAAPDEPQAKAFERGMELAADAKSPASLNRKILNRSEGSPDNSSLQKLVSSVQLVVYWQTSDLIPAAPMLKHVEVIAVPVWNVTEKVAGLGTKVFGFGYSTERSFAAFAKYAGTKLKSYRFAVLSSSTEPFNTQGEAFIEETKSQGNTIVFEEKVESAEADFKALINRATKETCDTIIAVLPADAVVSFVKAARAASFGGKILVGDSLFTAEREALGKDANGIYLLQSWSDDASLKAKYTSKYGSEPDGVTLGAAALGYDLIQCVEAVGANLNANSISYSWLSTPCEGLTGITQFSGERIAQRTKRILTVKDDKFELAAGSIE